jgi:hypothetical protein
MHVNGVLIEMQVLVPAFSVAYLGPDSKHGTLL